MRYLSACYRFRWHYMQLEKMRLKLVEMGAGLMIRSYDRRREHR